MADEGDAKEEVKAIDEKEVANAVNTMKEEVQSLVSRCVMSSVPLSPSLSSIHHIHYVFMFFASFLP
jgi:hypothetical protein